MNKLHIGDNLEIMKSMGYNTIDLIYLDPPFNSNKFYSSKGFSFNDRWKEDDYLTFMRQRLIIMRRLLKETGSIYLHCDPTASHYLKIMMDEIFGIKNFRNEIVWCYKGPSPIKNRFPKKHDIVFYYTKTDKRVFNCDVVRVPYTESKEKAMKRWAHTKSGIFTKDNFSERENKIKDLFERGGKIIEDWWSDIGAGGHIPKNELVGYPTQKPKKLLERIIKASSNEGDIVMDPFCGSGTTCVVAKQLNRQYIGIDLSDKAIELTKQRMLSNE